MQHDLHASKGS